MMEEAKWRKLGGGPLTAPNVQELAKQQLATLPSRYIRDDFEKTSYNLSMEQLPVIDMEQLLHGHHHDLELESLHSACKEWGFFQVVNHGVSSSLIEKVKSGIRALFNLPLEEKKKYQTKANSEGFGVDIVYTEEQKLDWVYKFFMTILPVNLRKPHLFDNFPVSFRENLEALSQEFEKLAISILCQLAKALKMDEKEMRNLYTDGVQIFRMNYYPPCPEPDKTYGLHPHSDSNSLTILLHLDETEGLQVRKDDTWMPVKPLPNALTVNVGDMMEIVSNGIYRSIEHRAVATSDETRISLAAFHTFNAHSQLGPSQGLIGPNNPPIFRRTTVGKSWEIFAKMKINGKSYVDFMKVDTKDGES